ncbi:MAG: hypothetical protein AAF604_21340 [Acidobacteriota bacterium]
MPKKCPHCSQKKLGHESEDLFAALDLLDPFGMLKAIPQGAGIHRSRYESMVKGIGEAYKVRCESCQGLCYRCPSCRKVNKLHGPPRGRGLECPRCAKWFVWCVTSADEWWT